VSAVAITDLQNEWRHASNLELLLKQSSAAVN
jgi:hypothetical protein